MGKLKQFWRGYVVDIIGNEKGIIPLLIGAGLAAGGAAKARRQRKKAEESARGVSVETEFPQPAPFPTRTPEAERLWKVSTGQLGDIMERPTGDLSPFARALFEQSQRQLKEQAAPGFFARGMGGQAGAAGLGAFQAREAPGLRLQAFGAGEEIERGRRSEARGFLETGLQERKAQYSPEEMRMRSAFASVNARRENAMRQRSELMARAKQYGGQEQKWGQVAGTMAGQVIPPGWGWPSSTGATNV